MATVASIRLFEAEPDLARYLASEDRALARDVRLPLVTVPPGTFDTRAVLQPHRAFAAIVLDGMLLQSLRLGEHDGLRLLGPGDMVSLTETAPSMLALEGECRATAPTRLILLGRELLLVTRRWPWLVAGLHAKAAEQAERLVTQLMICQLPRVDDRLLAMMWLLAESWGQVTASGTVLPVELTHSALGGLIGARRPTVTLALSELTERGAVVRQSDGWLLLQPPRAPGRANGEAVGEPRPVVAATPRWNDAVARPTDQRFWPDSNAYEELRETVTRLRTEHAERHRQMSQRLTELASAREEVAATRERIRSQVRPRPPAPS